MGSPASSSEQALKLEILDSSQGQWGRKVMGDFKKSASFYFTPASSSQQPWIKDLNKISELNYFVYISHEGNCPLGLG